MRQVTLAMLYGPKPSHLSELILECQGRVAHVLGEYFRPYNLYQVHATLVSLEEIPDHSEMNLNFKKYRGLYKRMDFQGLLDSIRMKQSFPFQVQIGGFQNRDYPFVSQERSPYERSFSIIDDKVVVMGWPVRTETLGFNKMKMPSLEDQGSPAYPNTLEEFRRSFQTFNVLHKYHRVDTDIDNDFYFRIGLVSHLLSDDPLRKQVEQDIRRFLSARKAITVDITRSDVFIVSFTDDKLLPGSTQAWSIDDTWITPEFISQLYKGPSFL